MGVVAVWVTRGTHVLTPTKATTHPEGNSMSGQQIAGYRCARQPEDLQTKSSILKSLLVVIYE